MTIDLAQKAVSLALSGKWEEAIEANKQILQGDSENIDALNRLGRAYAEVGKISKAKTLAHKVLKLDAFNTIAEKALKKWENLSDGQAIKSGPSSASEFLEEPGKTKLVSLMHLCNPDVIAKLDAGDEVKIHAHSHRISITAIDGTYIGKLPDDLSSHLRKLIQYGNEYKALIKAISTDCIKVLIRETKRTEKVAHIPSFSPEKVEYISFTPPELVHNKTNEFVQEETEETSSF